MALVQEYFELTHKYQNEYGEKTILLMQVGAFYEVYSIYDKNTHLPKTSSRIVDFSQICELNIAEKNFCVGEDNVMIAGFKDHLIEKYIRKLQDAGYTTVVYSQDENAKNTTRSLAGIFSPGTYFNIESPQLSNSVCCVWIDLFDNRVLQRGKFVVVGAANIDIFTGHTNLFQFKEPYIDNPTTYDDLERFVSIYQPNEVIFVSSLSEEEEMNRVLNYVGIGDHCTVHKIHMKSTLPAMESKILRATNCERQTYQREVLSKLYPNKNSDAFLHDFYEQNVATQALCYLLDFVHQHNPSLVSKLGEPVFENCSTRLLLANHSLKQLNIINDGTVQAGKYSCVSQMLNNCKTPMGRRRFLHNIVNPIFDEDVLQKEYDVTEYFLSCFDRYDGTLRQSLLNIKDLSKWERQVFLKKISPSSFCVLAKNLRHIKQLYDQFCTDIVLSEYFTSRDVNFRNVGTYCTELFQYIEIHLVLEVAKEVDTLGNFETNFFQSGVDTDLDAKAYCLTQSTEELERIRAYLSLQIEQQEKGKGKGKGKATASGDYVKIHETEKSCCGLVCTTRRAKLLMDSLPQQPTTVDLSFPFQVAQNSFSLEKQNASNSFIVHSHIDSVTKTIYRVKGEMKDLLVSVYGRFMERFEAFQGKLESVIQFVTNLDVLYTKAELAKTHRYCKPVLKRDSEKSFVDARQLRHCLIEQFHRNEVYVTNDVQLGTGSTDGILLYGTNAVGKTSLIRALGIAVIMAQAGLFVPCSAFVFKPYRHIFTRIIGNDNLFKGLSSFAVEMSELRTILRMNDENSLILGDELCSGTETMSAISIFVAGIQQLHRKKSSFIFATHLHEISDYEEIRALEGVALKHMEVRYDREKDRLVYNRTLQDGPGNNMYGLEVCKSLSLPQDFLDMAYEIRAKYHPQSQSILSFKQSRYNAQKLVGSCERCGRQGTEVHHLEPQMNADEEGFIATENAVFHKNALGNLETLCEECHLKEHHPPPSVKEEAALKRPRKSRK